MNTVSYFKRHPSRLMEMWGFRDYIATRVLDFLIAKWGETPNLSAHKAKFLQPSSVWF